MPPEATALELTAVNRPVRDLRQRLRTATGSAHARLDERFATLDLTRLPDYRRFLEASAAALLPLESALIEAGVARIFPDWPMRSRRHAILDDLADVDGEFSPLAIPQPLNFGGVLGAMYVLEGSRLGAAVLLKTIERSQDRQVASATAYLRHGTGQNLWRSFLVALDYHAAALDDDEAAVEGARLAFKTFDRAAAETIRA